MKAAVAANSSDDRYLRFLLRYRILEHVPPELTR
jgi:hypothetical protein